MGLFRKKPPKNTDPSPVDPFDLSHTLLDFGNGDTWRLRDACEGTQIFGATGSGKSSGSGRAIAKAFLSSGYGGLVLTAKPGEADSWKKYANETGRENDIVFFGEGQKHRFNFLEYELKSSSKGASDTQNLVQLFYSLLETIEGEANKSQDSFWERTLKQMLRNTVDLIKGSGEHLTLENLKQIIDSAPDSLGDVTNENSGWHEQSYCFSCIVKVTERIEQGQLNKSDRKDLDLTINYWLKEFPKLASRTRSIIVTSFTSMADCFLRGTLRELFCTKTNIFPELCRHGAVIVLNLNVKDWGEVGRDLQIHLAKSHGTRFRC